jgi:hypothetical protein
MTIPTRSGSPKDAALRSKVACVHQRDGVDGNDRLLSVPEGVSGKKARRPVTAQVGDDQPVAQRSQERATST